MRDVHQEKITYTALSAFRNCRQKYKHRYVDELVLDRPKGNALWIGTLFHEGIERFYNGESMTDIVSYVASQKDDLGDPDRWLRVNAMLIAYADKYKDEQLEIIALEDEFEVPIINPATGKKSTTMVLGGKIDGLVKCDDGAFAIFEHKTTAVPIQNYIKTLWSDFQTRLYCDAYSRYKGIKVNRAVFNIIKRSQRRRKRHEADDDFLIRLIEDTEFYRQELIFGKGMLGEIKTQLWDLKDNMQQARRENRWYKNESQCRSFFGICDYYDLCSSANNPIVRNSMYMKRERHEELGEGNYVTDKTNAT